MICSAHSPNDGAVISGYKLRRHIAKALQARSQAIRTALQKYNALQLDSTRRAKSSAGTELLSIASYQNLTYYAIHGRT